MIPKAVVVRLTPEDRLLLEARVRAPTTEQREVLRARIALLADEGRSTRAIAKIVGVMPRTVSLWRGRYAREGMAGLSGKPLPGAKPKYDACRPTSAFWRCWIGRRRRGFRPLDGSLIAAKAGRCPHAAGLARSARPRRSIWWRASPGARAKDPAVRGQGGGRGRAVHGSAGERGGHLWSTKSRRSRREGVSDNLCKRRYGSHSSRGRNPR